MASGSEVEVGSGVIEQRIPNDGKSFKNDVDNLTFLTTLTVFSTQKSTRRNVELKNDFKNFLETFFVFLNKQ